MTAAVAKRSRSAPPDDASPPVNRTSTAGDSLRADVDLYYLQKRIEQAAAMVHMCVAVFSFAPEIDDYDIVLALEAALQSGVSCADECDGPGREHLRGVLDDVSKANALISVLTTLYDLQGGSISLEGAPNRRFLQAVKELFDQAAAAVAAVADSKGGAA